MTIARRFIAGKLSQNTIRPAGTAEVSAAIDLSRSFGTYAAKPSFPAINRRAIFASSLRDDRKNRTIAAPTLNHTLWEIGSSHPPLSDSYRGARVKRSQINGGRKMNESLNAYGRVPRPPRNLPRFTLLATLAKFDLVSRGAVQFRCCSLSVEPDTCIRIRFAERG